MSRSIELTKIIKSRFTKSQSNQSNHASINETSSTAHDNTSSTTNITSVKELSEQKDQQDLTRTLSQSTSEETIYNSKTNFQKALYIIKKYISFVGPAIIISVAYLDPGNYSTAVTAGANNKYHLLFITFLSNIIAIFLQSLCIKLGSVTGYDLARCCREYLPKKLNLVLWVLAELAIIATDVAEVIGSAIALNILLKIPLPAGVVITIVDVLFVLMTYRADTSSMKFVKIFETTVGVLVLVVVICFAIQLSRIHADARDVFLGYIPSKEMFRGNGMTIATSIIGSTVMIHSLFLGSGLVQPRLREFDVKHGYVKLNEIYENSANMEKSNYEKESDFFYNNYKPSYKAINYSLKYSIIELIITLFTLALFVNSAILIVAGSTLYGTPEAIDADLYTIHDLLSKTIAPAMGTIFMVALLFSGQSAGIVCTIAGQVVSEGHIQWTLKPWLRRLITRSISIVPCLIISLCIGRNAMGVALNISQVIISILLPPLTAPLIYFTCSKKIMKVKIDLNEDSDDDDNFKNMANNWITTIIACIIWIFVSILNVYAIYQMSKNGVSG
ncbi:SMF1 [Candida jiufengensis]|uniref:SMF1 n=1 Tax=Candida jiufengensis TaxID=497108 RepID=UPI00222460DE|nr:SMF1 [Candida jiufengensis]KAI5952337.1 SMF1 [Candida jiufengensis]